MPSASEPKALLSANAWCTPIQPSRRHGAHPAGET
jgi:hypothetical protein